MWMFILEHALISGLLRYFLLSSCKGIANVLVVMGILIAFFTFVTRRTTIGRQIYALDGNENAAKLSGLHTEKLTWNENCLLPKK